MTEMQEIRAALHTLSAEFHEFRAVQAELLKVLATMGEGHHKTLYGAEGVTGLAARVQAVEEIARTVTTLPARVQTLEERTGLVWAGVLALVAFIGRWVWDVVAVPRP
jgi:membrane protein required for beta-lactamase induction